MSELKELQEKLLLSIKDKIARYGFDKKKEQSFFRKTSTGWEVFHISFIKHTDDFDLTADIAIRIDELEILVAQDHPLLKKSGKANTASIGAELGNISRGEQKRYTITNVRDVEPVAAEIMIDFASIALPYFKKFSDQNEVYQALIDNSKSGWLHSPFHDARCKRAVGLGYLLKKPDLKEVIARNDAFLQERSDFELKAYRKLVQDLRIT